MKFVEAFNALGYDVSNPRQDWSAENADGICLTLWSKETDWKAMVMDTREGAGDIAIWGSKPGNKKRIRHARRALDEFGGWVDVVKIDGEPGTGYGHASPWLPAERKGLRWRITSFEAETGHFRLEAQVPGN
jgi:hypothetical protein